jgi:hypothetical protein
MSSLYKLLDNKQTNKIKRKEARREKKRNGNNITFNASYLTIKRQFYIHKERGFRDAPRLYG